MGTVGRGVQIWVGRGSVEGELEKRKVAGHHGYGQCRKINSMCCMRCSVTHSPQRPAQPPWVRVCVLVLVHATK